MQGFQLHMHTLAGRKILLFPLGIWHEKNQLIGCSKILAEMIYQSKLPAEVESPVLNLCKLVTPSYPQVLQNTLKYSL